MPFLPKISENDRYKVQWNFLPKIYAYAQGWATGLQSRGICVPGQQSRDAGLGPGLIFFNLRGTGTHFRGTVPRGYGTGTENPASAGQQNPAGLGTVPHIFAVPRHSIIPQKIQRAFDLHLFLASKIAVTCFLMPNRHCR